MSIFPGNILIIDDQFNIGFQPNEPEDLSQKVQWKNFRRIRELFDNNGFCYSAITETKSIIDIVGRLKKHQNIRLIILDLDLDESGDVEDNDVEMVKKIITSSIDIFGYYFLAINSSYSEKWDLIKNELLAELASDPEGNKRKIHFLSNFCISFDKTNAEIENELLDLLSRRFSSELITQFEAKLNTARDMALSPFMDFSSETWEHFYKVLKEDMDSKEHIDLTISNFMFGLLKQHMIDCSYSVPTTTTTQFDPQLQKNIIKSFNYLKNTDNILGRHPIWTGNLYYATAAKETEKYSLVITPECDIAQSKGAGYTVISGFELEIPLLYNPDNFIVGDEPPVAVKVAGKTREGKWKTRSVVLDYFLKGQGFYPLLHSSLDDKHLVFDLRSAYRISDFSASKHTLHLRVNDPVITDIMDRFTAIFNRKGIPRLTSKDYVKNGF